jgi:hypothetical protein
MAGNPIKRARALNPTAAPSCLPPAEWRALSPGQKMEQLLGWSLDDAYTIAHWQPDEANVHQLSAKIRLIEIMTKHGVRFALEAHRDQERAKAIESLTKALQSDPTQDRKE